MSNSTQTRDINNTVSFYLNVTLVSVHPLVPNSDLFLIFRRIIHTPHHLRRALRAFINITSPTCRHPFARVVCFPLSRCLNLLWRDTSDSLFVGGNCFWVGWSIVDILTVEPGPIPVPLLHLTGIFCQICGFDSINKSSPISHKT